MKKQQQQSAPFCVRQGDVLLVDAAYRGNKSGTPIPLDGGRIVLAYGEVTGHAHAIAVTDPAAPPAQYFDADAERFLRALTDIPLAHEEHAQVMFSPHDPARGRYQQAFQVEERGEEVRQVAD